MGAMLAVFALPTAEVGAEKAGVRAAAAQSKSEVRNLQRALGIPADGAFGPQTERAIKRSSAGTGWWRTESSGR